ncbi:SET domain-containing protein, partial [Jaminaea rosea]
MAYGEDGRLKPECLGFNALSIFECTDACGCSEDCPNRVAQKGRKVPLEIFKTQKCGWGLRARNFIPAGTFITAYGGELCTNDEADQRGKPHEADPLPLARPPRQSYLSVDAGLYGNIARFLNHSCSPNLNQEYVWLSSDLDFARPRACFFTNRDVAAGEELRFSY